MNTTEHREERDQPGHEEQAERREWWEAGGGGADCFGLPASTGKGPGLAAEDNFCQQPASCPPPARCSARPRAALPVEPELWRSLHHPGYPASAHPRRPPPSLLTCGPEGAGGPGPGLAGSRERSSPALAALRDPQSAARLRRHQLLRGCGARGPGLRGAPGRRSRGPGAGSGRKHPAT